MATIDDQLAVARVYSRAMLEIAEKQGEADQLLAELTDLAALLARDPEIAAVFASPLVDVEAKAKLLEKVFRGRASDLLVDSLLVINRKERLDILPAVAESYRREHRDLRGVADVYVKTAVPLSEALRERLTAAASRFTGLNARLVESVEPGLLGGMVLQVGDEKIDASVASRLKALSESLLRRGSEEIYRGTAYSAAE
jgi:F-type H+-transporting ATPase subunit delta